MNPKFETSLKEKEHLLGISAEILADELNVFSKPCGSFPNIVLTHACIDGDTHSADGYKGTNDKYSGCVD
jgi:hypothetical protein